MQVRGRAPSRCLALIICAQSLCAAGVTFRYFYDDANQLFRVLDSTGTLVEYDYDPAGNITQVTRSTVPPASLAILNITPLSGASGSTVTIYGQNFSSVAAGDLVQFGGVAATVVSASLGALVVQVPAGFATGQISVTVNGVTVNSGSLTFIPPPSINSVTPAFGFIGQTLTNVVVQGTNLSGVTYTLSGGGTVTPVSTSATQATVNITLGQTPGPSVLMGTNNSGTSTSQAAPGNFIEVYNTAGTNYSDALISVFNTAGTTPNFPAGTNRRGQTFSVFNNAGTNPNFPPGTNLSGQTFSVFNNAGPTPNFPAGTNMRGQTFSVFNSNGPTPNFPAGSNWAWQLFSTQNTSNLPPAALPISILRNGRPAPARNPGEILPGVRAPLSVIAGQQMQIDIRPPLFLHYLELDANGTPLAASTGGSLHFPLIAPFGVRSFSLRAFGFTSLGTTSDSQTETVEVEPDPGRTIGGRVVDANGAPVAGAVVTWTAHGMAAEYYGFPDQLRAIPELRGAPARAAFLGALDFPNPQQVFGKDPMGVGLGPNYAVHLSGTLQVDVAGIYEFELLAHRGARLTIDGQVVAEASATGADAATAMGSANLTAGAHDIAVAQFESDGAAALELKWALPGGVPAAIPPAAITSEAPAMWRASTDSSGRFVLHVPAALDGVSVKLAAGQGSVQLDR